MSSENTMCQCCTCGFEWIRGQDGSHSCALKLRNDLDIANEKIEKIESLFDVRRWNIRASNAWNKAIPDVKKAFRDLRSSIDPEEFFALEYAEDSEGNKKIHAAPSKYEAEVRVSYLNALIKMQGEMEDNRLIKVIVWPFDPESHAEDLKGWERE